MEGRQMLSRKNEIAGLLTETLGVILYCGCILAVVLLIMR
jgi:hypothetical protein